MALPCGNSQLCCETSPTQLRALKQKHPMALPQGSPQLRYEATPNLVVGPLRSSTVNSVPSSAMDNKNINLMHTDRFASWQSQLSYGAINRTGTLGLDRIYRNRPTLGSLP
jgi:hypothetical protein